MPSTSAKEKGSTRSCSRASAVRYGSGKMSGRVDRSWPSLMNVGPMRSRSLASSEAAVSVAAAAGLSSSRVGSRPAALTRSPRPYLISETATSLYRFRCCGLSDSPMCLLYDGNRTCRDIAGAPERAAPPGVGPPASGAIESPASKAPCGIVRDRALCDQLGSLPLEVEDPEDTGVPGCVHRHIRLRDEDLIEEVGSPQRGQHRLSPFTIQVAHAALGEQPGMRPAQSVRFVERIDDQVHAPGRRPAGAKVGGALLGGDDDRLDAGRVEDGHCDVEAAAERIDDVPGLCG